MSAKDSTFLPTEHEQKSLGQQKLVRTFLMFMTAMLVVPVLAILGVIIARGAPGMSLEFLTERPLANMTAGGISFALIGTVWLTSVALLLALPLGVSAAIYLSEYARDNWLTRVINIAIVNLAGVPSIVHALFGVGAFVHFLQFGKSILAASCTLAVMTLPVVIVATRESLQAVPQPFREACWSLGATRWQTIWRVVLPNSGSGILTGVILCVSRAVGETAPIMFTGAVLYAPFSPEGVFDQSMALSTHLYNVSTQIPNVPPGLPFSVALTLIGVVLAMNATAITFRMRLRGRKKW